jgi:hypothetical protein
LYNSQLLSSALILPTLLDGSQILQVTKNIAGLYINGAPVSRTDIRADDGIIHIVDQVLKPPLDLVARLNELDQFRLFANVRPVPKEKCWWFPWRTGPAESAVRMSHFLIFFFFFSFYPFCNQPPTHFFRPL